MRESRGLPQALKSASPHCSVVLRAPALLGNAGTHMHAPQPSPLSLTLTVHRFLYHGNSGVFSAFHPLLTVFATLLVLICIFSQISFKMRQLLLEFHPDLWCSTCNPSQKWAKLSPATPSIEVNLAKHKRKKKNTTFTLQLVTAHSLLIYSALLAKTLHTFNHISKKGVKRQVFLNCLS